MCRSIVKKAVQTGHNVYRLPVDRHLWVVRSFPSLAETHLPILRFLTRHSGLTCLGGELNSAELNLLVPRDLVLPPRVPRIPRTTARLPRIFYQILGLARTTRDAQSHHVAWILPATQKAATPNTVPRRYWHCSADVVFALRPSHLFP